MYDNELFDNSLFDNDLFEGCETIEELKARKAELDMRLEIDHQRQMMEIAHRHNMAMNKISEVTSLIRNRKPGEDITDKVKELLEEARKINIGE